MLSCGEPSGDLYAGALTTELRDLEPEVQVFGLGGERFEAAGGRLVASYKGLTVTGLAEVLSVLPHSWRVYRSLVATARSERPDVLVLIDYPDFNFRLGQAVAGLGVPVVYYICPQVWAWRASRLATMRRFVSRALVIFPFETSIYEEADIPVSFVGHPLLELARPARDREAFREATGLDQTAPLVALLPGSRPNELRAILPDLIGAARLIRDQVPRAQFVVARAPALSDELFRPLAELTPQPLLVASSSDDVLNAADVVLTASGTATVQTAIHGRPMVVVYRLSRLSYWIGRRFVRVDAFGMVNLVTGRKVVPELLQQEFTPEAVAAEAVRFLSDDAHAAATRADLRSVRDALGGPGASARVAQRILEVARRSDLDARIPDR
tara:strand:- start:3475 stop:4623 length:1149 start_codon:yes stop_codon:yes gene_type:complete